MFQLTELPLSDNTSRRSAEAFLLSQGLRLEASLDIFLVALRDDEIVACGGMTENVLKCLAVREDERGEGLLTLIVSRLISIAAERGYSETLLFTKPQYRRQFEDLGYTIEAEAPKAVLMTSNPLRMMTLKKDIENFRRQSLAGFKEQESAPRSGVIVMNADPPTLGHKALISYAVDRCDMLFIFLTCNPSSFLPEDQRDEIVLSMAESIKQEKGRDLNVMIVNDPFTLSADTFPTYFIKECSEVAETEMRLNLDLFRRVHIPFTRAAVRFVGSEPFDPLTRRYNELMRELLPIEIDELPRVGGISASAVRRRPLLPVAHTVSWKAFSALISKYLREALLAELDLTPKPGLVDKLDSGAHADMNYNTMLHGIEAISNSPIITLSTFFYSRLSCRMTFEQRKEHIKRNLNALIEETLSATGGVNTHKGFIFAAMCVVVGLGLKAANDTEHYIGPVTPESLQKAIKEAAAYASADPASHGTRACKRYKTGGALAMAQSGYEPLFSCWLPLWRQTHNAHRLLLTIMSQLDDTCLLHRGGKKALTWAKQQAREALEDLSPERLARMNEAFVSSGLSPGGSADMFALTRFIDKLV